MNTDEALRLLNLNRNYTEDDLKREYRKLVIKYHPDKNGDKDKTFYEEKTKLLNEAKDILTKNLKDRSVGQQNNNDNYWSNMTKEKYDYIYEREMKELDRLKKLYKEELRNELSYIYDVDFRDKLFMKWKDRFLDTIYDFYNCMDKQPNSISLKLNYAVYKEEYFKLICWYLYDHWNNSKIIDFAGNLDIDKNDGIKNVRNKMISTIRSILDIEMEEFKNIDNYSDIESLLLGYRNGFIDICLYGYDKIEKVKSEFKNRIVLEINKYKQRKEIIDNLTKYYGYPTKLVVELYNNILDEDKFNTLYNEKVDFKTKVKAKAKNIFSK